MLNTPDLKIEAILQHTYGGNLLDGTTANKLEEWRTDGVPENMMEFVDLLFMKYCEVRE